ncbi:MAG: site-2 protease family protein [Candidatus Odinarchaeia archaeon]
MIQDILLNPFILLIFFWIVLFIIGEMFHVEKWGVQISIFFFIFKTKKANRTIGELSQKHPRIWVTLWSLGVAVSLMTIVFVLYFLTNNLIGLLIRPSQAAPLTLIIPGITITGLTLVYFIFPFFITVIAHEFAHGIAANNADIPVKSAGFFLALIFPGAFVEPEEEKLKKASLKDKLRIYSAGSFANLILAIIGLLLITPVIFSAVIYPLYEPSQGVIFQETVPGSPISGYVSPPFVLTGVNINGTTGFIPISSPSDFFNIMRLTNPYTNLTLYTDQGIFTVSLTSNPENPSLGFLGVVVTTMFYYYPPRPWAAWLGPIFPYHLYQVFNWLWIISFSLGIFNLLPIPFFDGEKIVSSILEHYIPDSKKIKLHNREIRVNRIILNTLRVFSTLVLVLNLVVSFIAFPSLF